MIYNPRGKRAKDVYGDVFNKKPADFIVGGIRNIIRKNRQGQPEEVQVPTYYNPSAAYGKRNRKTGEQGKPSDNYDRNGIPQVGSGPGKEGDEISRYKVDDGQDGKKGGRGPSDPTYGEITRADLIEFFTGLELELIKPGKKMSDPRTTWPVISKYGPDSTFDLRNTVMAAYLRQTLADPEGDFDPSELEKKDRRYRLSRTRYQLQKDAKVIFVRDVSGSISENELEMSYALSFLIEKFLEWRYEGCVEAIYVPHNSRAWEETRKGYYDLRSSGGTDFQPAYELIGAMIAGHDYERSKGVTRKQFNPTETDVYVVQLTDGETWGTTTAIKSLEALMPSLTRYCYLETHYGFEFGSGVQYYRDFDSVFQQDLRNTFPDLINAGIVRIAKSKSIDDIVNSLQVFFGKNYMAEKVAV